MKPEATQSHGVVALFKLVAVVILVLYLSSTVVGCGVLRLSDNDMGANSDAGNIANEEATRTLRDRPVARSLIQLIANPERYRSARASVTGYLMLGPSPDKNEHGYLVIGRGLESGLEVHFGPCEYTPTPWKPMTRNEAIRHLETFQQYGEVPQGYAEVRGIFEPPRDEKYLYRQGTICGISSITELKPRTDIDQ